jgi:hypothetical protein
VVEIPVRAGSTRRAVRRVDQRARARSTFDQADVLPYVSIARIETL